MTYNQQSESEAIDRFQHIIMIEMMGMGMAWTRAWNGLFPWSSRYMGAMRFWV